MVCHYLSFNHDFEFQDYVCNGCQDLLIQWVYFSDIAIITVKGTDYGCIIHEMSRSDAIDLFKRFLLNDCG